MIMPDTAETTCSDWTKKRTIRIVRRAVCEIPHHHDPSAQTLLNLSLLGYRREEHAEALLTDTNRGRRPALRTEEKGEQGSETGQGKPFSNQN